MGKQRQVHNGKTYTYDRPIHHFSPRDLARIIDKMRTQGIYDDYTIARAITDVYGVTDLICAVTKLFSFLQWIGFITAILMFLKAVKTLIKAFKLLKVSPLAKLIEYGIGLFKFVLQYSDVVLYARFLVYLSIFEAVVALAILYVDLVVSGLSVWNETNLICEAMNVVDKASVVSQSFINLNDDFYGIIEKIKQEHQNLKQYDDDISKLDNNVNNIDTWFPDA